jgi:quinol monooxygenase YgiN
LYNLHQGIEDKNHFVFYEIWKSEEGLAQHNEQPYIKAFGALIDEKLQEIPQFISPTLFKNEKTDTFISQLFTIGSIQAQTKNLLI